MRQGARALMGVRLTLYCSAQGSPEALCVTRMLSAGRVMIWNKSCYEGTPSSAASWSAEEKGSSWRRTIIAWALSAVAPGNVASTCQGAVLGLSATEVLVVVKLGSRLSCHNWGRSRQPMTFRGS